MDGETREVEIILSQLAQVANLPMEQATTIPAQAYTNRAFLALELKEIFAKEWVCAGRVEEVPNPGDYFATEIAGEPLLIVRGEDDRVRVLSNVCRHRWAQVASGHGTTKRFVCPYHAWTYDCEGRLVHTRFMEKSRAFDPDCRLPEISSEIWQGFLFVNLDGKATPLGSRLGSLLTRIEDYHLEEMTRFTGADEIWRTNWKLLTENFTEAYHNPQTHKHSLEPAVPAALTRYPGGEDAYSLMIAPVNPQCPLREPHHPDLSGTKRSEVVLACIFPSLVFALSPERVFYMCLSPVDVDNVQTRWGVGTWGALPKDPPLEEINRLYHEVNDEDKLRLESIQKTIRSRYLAPGPLSYMEQPNWELYRYMARRLIPNA